MTLYWKLWLDNYKFETLRAVFHSFNVCLLTYLATRYFVGNNGFLYAATLACGIELLRVIPFFKRILDTLFASVMRAKEKNGQVCAVPPLTIGMYIACVLVPEHIWLITLHTAFVDPIAGQFGRRFGKNRPQWMQGKSVDGTQAGLVAALLIVVAYSALTGRNLGFVAILLAPIVSATELLGKQHPFLRNDNLLIPFIEAVCIKISTLFLP